MLVTTGALDFQLQVKTLQNIRSGEHRTRNVETIFSDVTEFSLSQEQFNCNKKHDEKLVIVPRCGVDTVIAKLPKVGRGNLFASFSDVLTFILYTLGGIIYQSRVGRGTSAANSRITSMIGTSRLIFFILQAASLTYSGVGAHNVMSTFVDTLNNTHELYGI